MSTNEKKSRDDSERNERDPQNTLPQDHPQKQWDERPGQRDSDPQEQQRQRQWEEAEKKQEKNALRPGVDERDMKQHDEEGTPRSRGEDFQS